LSLAYRAVLGAIWTIASSLGGRAIGLVATLVLTRFLAPADYGEVSVAVVVVMTVSYFAAPGFGQYVVANPKASADTVFHFTALHTVIGLVALLPLLALPQPLAALFDAPGLAAFVPGLVLSALLERLAYIPGRLLARDMRFKRLGAMQLAGEVVYAGSSVYLASLGWGGGAIVAGNVARAMVRVLVGAASVDYRAWLVPHRLNWITTRKMLRFGVPMWGAISLHWLSMRGDNLLMAFLFGPATVGRYNLAYNLADIPASQVGEHIGDVLLPSFARIDDREARKRALSRAAGLLALVVFPLAVGLGAIAHTLVAVLFDERWAGVAPMLVLLSVLSVVRPIGWLATTYFEATQRTRTVLALEAAKVTSIATCVIALSRVSELWACAGVGVAFALSSTLAVFAIHRGDGMPVLALVSPLVRPLLACLPMVGAVLGVRHVFDGQGSLWLLLLELVVGAVSYVVSALVIAPAQARDILQLLRGALRRRSTTPVPDSA
jgi:PST family polysaccharide transporter